MLSLREASRAADASVAGGGRAGAGAEAERGPAEGPRLGLKGAAALSADPRAATPRPSQAVRPCLRPAVRLRHGRAQTAPWSAGAGQGSTRAARLSAKERN
jgi:hypothetical protein